MSRVVFLLEERSMAVLLDQLLPRLMPRLNFLCVWHEGKRDLDLSIPRKLRAWQEPGVRFVVMRDNDRGDCQELKRRLVELCSSAGRPDTLIRIVCQELESWYLGDPEALAAAFGQAKLRRIADKPKYRNPDAVHHPSVEMAKLVPQFQKLSAARRMAPQLDPHRNCSRSFQVFLSGVEKLVGQGQA